MAIDCVCQVMETSTNDHDLEMSGNRNVEWWPWTRNAE